MFIGILWAATAAMAMASNGQDTIIVGSSTVGPYADLVAQRVTVGTVIVNATGSNDGIRAFCTANDTTRAAVTLASRRMSLDEQRSCSETTSQEITEYKLGLNGVILVNYHKNALESFSLTTEQLFLALATEVPDASCQLNANTYTRWSQIEDTLPDLPIQIFGPSKRHGIYSTFVDTALVAGAKSNACMKTIDAASPGTLKKTAKAIRTDGVWTDMPEDKIQLIPVLRDNPDAIGILAFNFAKRFRRHLREFPIANVYASVENVADGSYPLAGALWMYSHPEGLAADPVAKAFVDLFNSDEAIGARGFLTQQGLISVR